MIDFVWLWMVVRNTLSHFITGGILGLTAYFFMKKITKKPFFSFAFTVWFVILTHLIIDYLGWF